LVITNFSLNREFGAHFNTIQPKHLKPFVANAYCVNYRLHCLHVRASEI